MATTPDEVRAALEDVEHPDLGVDLVEAGLIEGVEVDGGQVRVGLRRLSPRFGGEDALVTACREAVEDLPGVEAVEVTPRLDVPVFHKAGAARPAGTPDVPGADPWAEQGPLGQVRNVVAISSGKGGVGKSTVAANLAVSLAAAGARVGLMDADIYGPSGPMMMGLAGKPKLVGDKLQPLENHGVRVMSIGFLTGTDDAQVWRGPMVQSAVRQFLKDVDWGELDYLLVDMPPGTGDAQLTLVQQVPLTGAVVVSTPQAVALADVRKGVTMFRRVEVEVLGVVENMSYFVCDRCEARHEIFASAGAEHEAERQGVPFLGRLPLNPVIREGGDSGVPAAVEAPEGPLAEAFRQLADGLARQVARRAFASGAAAAAAGPLAV